MTSSQVRVIQVENYLFEYKNILMSMHIHFVQVAKFGTVATGILQSNQRNQRIVNYY